MGIFPVGEAFLNCQTPLSLLYDLRNAHLFCKKASSLLYDLRNAHLFCKKASSLLSQRESIPRCFGQSALIGYMSL
jgi:hypothetical protein